MDKKENELFDPQLALPRANHAPFGYVFTVMLGGVLPLTNRQVYPPGAFQALPPIA
ncbi:hypothetical protein IVA79_17665 [Bradyrhizobium sp. 138]|uniref:hypothetical protein n=1 Tax=Bradyrhizobium sp. 138 TaxID=2782615 RepID=UPI001FF9E74D|nr:hypothetical protein [Bradyrhizobium sp. 138]MCK1735723.1 hypothetical protein [Bradyrhizobium sp. 138]